MCLSHEKLDLIFLRQLQKLTTRGLFLLITPCPKPQWIIESPRSFVLNSIRPLTSTGHVRGNKLLEPASLLSRRALSGPESRSPQESDLPFFRPIWRNAAWLPSNSAPFVRPGRADRWSLRPLEKTSSRQREQIDANMWEKAGLPVRWTLNRRWTPRN